MFLRNYRFVEALVDGNLEQVRAWFSGKNHALGAVPLEMMKTIVGMVRVESYLQEMAAR